MATSPTVPSAAAAEGTPPTQWTQIVRGPESDPIVSGAAVDAADVNAATASKKPAWNKNAMPKPDVGPGESAGGAAAFMGVTLWPSLSEGTTKSTQKPFSSSDPSNTAASDFGLPLSVEVTGIDSSTNTAAVASAVRSPTPTVTAQKPTTSYPKHNLTSNHGQLGRQKSAKREGEGNSQPNGVFSHQPPQPAGDGSHYHHSHGSPKPNSGGNSENAGKDNVQAQSHRESGQKNLGGDHPHHRNSFRKGNGGPQSRGDGSHQNYGGRRSNQERGNHDWNHQKSFNGRDPNLQPAVVSRGFVRPPPVAAPFIHHPAVQPLINPMLPDVPFFYIPPGMQLVAPVPQMYFPAPDPELYTEIMKQIDYYFSNENLVRDTFLRQKMDENGWVSVGVISDFNRVRNLTNDTFQILEAVRPSTVVEVQGDKLRRRDDWMRWVMPPSVQLPISPGSQSPKGPLVAEVTNRTQSISLDEKTNDASIVKGAIGGSSSVPQAGANKASPGGC